VGLRERAEKALQEQEMAKEEARLLAKQQEERHVIDLVLPEAVAKAQLIFDVEPEAYYVLGSGLKVLLDGVPLDYINGEFGYLYNAYGSNTWVPVMDLPSFARASRSGGAGGSYPWTQYEPAQ
jgi:hypothetical protein